MHRIALVTLAVALLAASGCYRTTARRSSTPIEHGPNYERWHHSLFFGLIRVSPDIDIDKICGDAQVSQVHTQISFGNGLLSVLTSGIYTPTKLKIWCAPATTHRAAAPAASPSATSPSASGTTATSPTPTRRRRGAVTTEQDPFNGTVVRMQMDFPGARMSLAAAPEKRPGQLVLAISPGSAAAADCQRLQVAAGKERETLELGKKSGSKLAFAMDADTFDAIVNGRPLVMRLCGTDLRFDRMQLQTLERFAEELARVRSSSGTRGGDRGSAPSP